MSNMIPHLVESLRDTLKTEGRGHTLKRLKHLGCEQEIMSALLWMLEHGEAERNGKGWRLRETTVQINGVEYLVNDKPPEHLYPTIHAGLTSQGYERYHNRIIRRIKR